MQLENPYHAGNVGKLDFSTKQSKLTRRKLSGGPASRLKHWCDPVELWTPKREYVTELPTSFVKNAVAERNNRIVLAAEEAEMRKREISEADMEAEEKALHAAAPLIEKLKSDYTFLLSQMRHKALTEKERQEVIDRWRSSLVGVPTWVLQIAMRDGNRINSALGPVLSIDRREETQQRLIDELRGLAGEVRASREGVPLREAPPMGVPVDVVMGTPIPDDRFTSTRPTAPLAPHTRRAFKRVPGGGAVPAPATDYPMMARASLGDLSRLTRPELPIRRVRPETPLPTTPEFVPTTPELQRRFEEFEASEFRGTAPLGTGITHPTATRAVGRSSSTSTMGAHRPAAETPLPVGRRFGPESKEEREKKEEKDDVGETTTVPFTAQEQERLLGKALVGVPATDVVVYTTKSGTVRAIYKKPDGTRENTQVNKLPLDEFKKAGIRTQPSKNAADNYYDKRIRKKK